MATFRVVFRLQAQVGTELGRFRRLRLLLLLQLVYSLTAVMLVLR